RSPRRSIMRVRFLQSYPAGTRKYRIILAADGACDLAHGGFCVGRGHPTVSVFNAAFNIVKERTLQTFRDRSSFSVSDGDVVNRANGSNLSSRAGHEELVANIQQLPWEQLLHHVVAEFSGQRYDTVPGDAGENGAGDRSRVDGCVANHKHILPTTFADVSAW